MTVIHQRVCGIETEYGIFVEGGDVSAVAASTMLVKAYSTSSEAAMRWDFNDETPHVDARGASVTGATYPVVDAAMSNSVLTNGARFYVDHAHPEFSTPECLGAEQAVLYDLAGEEIVRRALSHANASLPEGVRLRAHKNNSDGRGNSYGCHENYLVNRDVPFGLLSRALTTHFITRQVFSGAGKFGVELPREGEPRPAFQISQRADFFEEEVGLETTVRRPIINTRDEPHCDATKWRRLHVIAGDANMSQVATFVKLGSTSLLLSLLEAGLTLDDLVIDDPVSQIRGVSHDPSLQHLVNLADGRRMTALQIQFTLLERARSHAGTSVEVDSEMEQVLTVWEELLSGLERDPSSMSHLIDWVAKKALIDGLMRRHGLSGDHPRLRAVDLQYHDMDPGRGLHHRLGMRQLHDAESVTRAVSSPPETTRAFFRGECVSRWSGEIASANWDSIVFADSRGRLKRVAMMDPLKGTRERVGSLLNEALSVDDLLARLGDEVVEPVVADPGW